MSEPAGLTFLRRAVEQGRLPDIGDLRLMLKDFADLEQQDEIHWKTRRKLLKDREALEQRVERLEKAVAQASAQAFICLELGIVTLAKMRTIHDVLGEALVAEEEA